MGAIEEEIKRELRKSHLKRAVLGSIAAAGMLSVALVAPNALSLLKPLGFTKQQKHKTNEAFKKLLDRKLLFLEKTDRGTFARLTLKGEQHLSYVRERTVPKQKRWDKKWRVIIFDIPEQRKTARNQVRSTLIQTGFIRLQDSVWVYPYPCEELIALLKADLNFGRELLYMIVDSIENDKALRLHFKLK